MPKRRVFHQGDISSKRRKRRKSKIFFYFLAPLVFTAAIILVLRIDGLQIKGVQVSETRRIDAAKVRESAENNLAGSYFGLIPKKSFLFYPRSKIVSEIKNLEPAILDIETNLGFDRTLNISLSERLSEAIWCKSENECYHLDNNGIVFAEAESTSTGAKIKYSGLIGDEPLGKRFGSKGSFTEIYNLTEKMESLGFNPISVNVSEDNVAQMHFSDGSRFIFESLEQDKDFFYENITTFINELKSQNGGQIPLFDYIDARYGNKIFYRMRETGN